MTNISIKNHVWVKAQRQGDVGKMGLRVYCELHDHEMVVIKADAKKYIFMTGNTLRGAIGKQLFISYENGMQAKLATIDEGINDILDIIIQALPNKPVIKDEEGLGYTMAITEVTSLLEQAKSK